MGGWRLGILGANGPKTGSEAVSITDKLSHAGFSYEFKKQHLDRGPKTAALSAGCHAVMAAKTAVFFL